ncbi:MAG: prepilin-type N-terminal cleavage/methylation domain-containing protein [Puniceicoccales bacterium]|nr:prepilin-type N-terminal cleavage/methylation domain-containing protein [Puniceicoccales bacterium]
MPRKAFTLLELLMTVGVLAILLLFAGHTVRKNMTHQQLTLALRILENFLSLAITTARLEHVYVRILWDVADPSSGREPQLFLLSSTKIGPSAEWKLCRTEYLPEHCRFFTQVGSDKFQAGDIVNVSEDWITGVSTTFASGTIPLREWLFDSSGELMDAEGGVPPYRSIGIGYGKIQSPLGCVLVNANGHIQLYEGIETVQDVLSKIKLL